ncbi:MAG: regulatory iron-sulfur-containing complex subunit RicT [Odoribacter sp.]
MSELIDNENIDQDEELFSDENEDFGNEPTEVEAEVENSENTLEIKEEIVVEEFEEEEEESDEMEASEAIEAGEFAPQKKKEDEEEEVQPLHTKHPRPDIPIIDHRLLSGKLSVYNWLEDLPTTNCVPEIVEVQFKNTRKGFYNNPSNLPLQKGDIVAVEAALGHDIGVISLSGELVKEQIRLKRIDLERNPLKKVYRKAKPHDIEKWQQAIALEHETMIRSRKIAADLNLNMKIGDVEYQGDKTKAIFYYIADDRVDFRTLIKVLAETFRIRIEMKQIGTRQEAGRIGGIGPCGRKLCCSSFITNFISVSTSAARYQDISLNPQKLAGQCGKLKCCLNYEVDAYLDAQKDFPSSNIPLNTGNGLLYHQKTDIFGQMMSYTPDKEGKGIFIQIPVRRVKEIITMNRKGIIPPQAVEIREDEPVDIKYTDGVGEESLNRFDEKKQKKQHSKFRNNNNRENGNNNVPRNEKIEKTGGSEGRNENKNAIPNNGSDNNNRPNNNRQGSPRPFRNGPRPEQRKDPKSLSKPKPKTDQDVKPQNEQ